MKKVGVFTLMGVVAFVALSEAFFNMESRADSLKKQYISDLKIYIAHTDSIGPKAWCERQVDNFDEDEENDWHVLSEDLNKGGDASVVSPRYVYLLCRITDDPKEAIRDIAVMNEQGNYSVGGFEMLLKEQNKVFNGGVAVTSTAETYNKSIEENDTDTLSDISRSINDVAMTVQILKAYYSRKHLLIPGQMVNMLYKDGEENSYIVYDSVSDAAGNNGDLNGGTGRQWLALYATKDEAAGEPIFAPMDEKQAFIRQTGKKKIPDGYSPLHSFGYPDIPQNLTFADEKEGWSYNDRSGGVYLFFARDNGAVNWNKIESDSQEDATRGEFIERGLVLVTILFWGHLAYRRRKK